MLTHLRLMVVMLPVLAVPAFAQTPDTPTKGKLRAACTEDVQKHCATIERGKGQLRGCLASHESELSPACKIALDARKR